MGKLSSTYRPDIDGLRAIAILGVLVFHIHPSLLAGGYIGVDVFFVISGYLITGIITRELAEGSFSLTGFYERRIRRIFPALLAMLLIVLIAGTLFLFPKDLEALAKSSRYTLSAIANLHFLKEAEGYFNASVQEMPLLHMWSLAVEEQFYLLFPLLMLVLHRNVKSPRRRLAFLLVVFSLSLAWSIHLVAAHALSAFFILPSRAWEIMLGSLLACSNIKAPAGKSWFPLVMGSSGLFLIAACMVTFSSKTPFPGIAALAPCLGTAMIIAGGMSGKNPVSRLLSIRPLVLLGKISYSVYLWHWPLIAMLHYRYPHNHSWRWWVFTASLILGWLSWRWIERPFRNPSFLSRRQIYVSWLISTIGLILVAILIRKADGFPQRYAPQVIHYLSYQEMPHRFSNVPGKRGDVSKAPTHGTPNSSVIYAVWGDSHSEALMPLLDSMAQASGISLRQYGRSGEAPIPGVMRTNASAATKNEEYSAAVMADILSKKEITTVILHARWSSYLKGPSEEENPTPPSFRGHTFTTPQELETWFLQNLDQTIKRLLAAGKRVVLVYPIPEPGMNVPRYLAQTLASHKPLPDSIPYPFYQTRHEAILRFFDSLQDTPQLIKIRPASRLLTQDRIIILTEGEPVYMDDDHLSESGALSLRPLFSEIFMH